MSLSTLTAPRRSLFHKRTLLYGADLARAAVREAGWVAVVEGYTDVIAAHQVGLENVVGTLGTALGEDHLRALRRLADQRGAGLRRGRGRAIGGGSRAGVVPGQRAGSARADPAGEPRPLRLPSQGRGRRVPRLAERAVDPLAYLLARAAARFDLDSIEGSRRAAEWVLGILSRVPETPSAGSRGQEGQGPRHAVAPAPRPWRRSTACSGSCGGRAAEPACADAGAGRSGAAGTRSRRHRCRPAVRRRRAGARSARATSIPTDLELIQIVLNEPAAIAWLDPSHRRLDSARRPACGRSSRPATTCIARDRPPSYENLMVRLEDPAFAAWRRPDRRNPP